MHLSILYDYQQFFQHRICFSIQRQLQLVNLHRNWRYFLIKFHTWFCLSYFLKTNIKFIAFINILYEYQQFFQHRICFSIQSPDYSDPWPRLARPSSFFLIRLLNNVFFKPFLGDTLTSNDILYDMKSHLTTYSMIWSHI